MNQRSRRQANIYPSLHLTPERKAMAFQRRFSNSIMIWIVSNILIDRQKIVGQEAGRVLFQVIRPINFYPSLHLAPKHKAMAFHRRISNFIMIWIVSVKCFAWGGTKTGIFTDLRPFSNPMISEFCSNLKRIRCNLFHRLFDKNFDQWILWI